MGELVAERAFQMRGKPVGRQYRQAVNILSQRGPHHAEAGHEFRHHGSDAQDMTQSTAATSRAKPGEWLGILRPRRPA